MSGRAISVQANWFLDALNGVEEPDPLGPAQTRIEDIGQPIDLSSGEAELNQRLIATIGREAELYDTGIVCPIKDVPQSCCSACAVRRTDELDPMTPLCHVGVEQERLTTAIVIAHDQQHAA